jgi:hypothetical protein
VIGVNYISDMKWINKLKHINKLEKITLDNNRCRHSAESIKRWKISIDILII